MAFAIEEQLSVLEDNNRRRSTLELIRFNGSGNQALRINQITATAEEVRHKSMILDIGAGYALLTALEGYFRG